MALKGCPVTVCLRFTNPDKRDRISIPMADSGLQSQNNLVKRSGKLTVNGTPFEKPLDGFSHIQPGTAQWGLQRQNSMLKTPDKPFGIFMTDQVIHNQPEL
jgi:hypothetical protein